VNPEVIGPEILYVERFTILHGDYEHGGDAAAAIKSILKELDIHPDQIRRLSIANFEAEMNVIMYAQAGEMELQVLADSIRIVLTDRGQGIPDIELAMTPGYSTATPAMRERGFGAGLGLPNIKKNVDRFEIESAVGVGTTLRYAIFLNDRPRTGEA
jgi:anti-sigma regulatory factor (Ser/Thr protein kinase)